jgi:hypothetical protein
VSSKSATSYWESVADVVSDESIMVWKQLEKDMQNYCSILTQRSETLLEVHRLATKNAELKELLNTYMKDPRNDDLLMPPTMVGARHRRTG